MYDVPKESSALILQSLYQYLHLRTESAILLQARYQQSDVLFHPIQRIWSVLPLTQPNALMGLFAEYFLHFYCS
ncbi:Uncharacterised protein [Chlamydia trachomatis]|nr:Uncharacterised protein [Chlamydia trachomatis]